MYNFTGQVNQLNREPEKPTLEIEAKEAIISAGGSHMIDMKCKGFPKPQVKFTHDGKPIEPGNKYKYVYPRIYEYWWSIGIVYERFNCNKFIFYRILYEDEESISLVIKNVEPADAGKYECTAENELGIDKADMKLIVKGIKFIQYLNFLSI